MNITTMPKMISILLAFATITACGSDKDKMRSMKKQNDANEEKLATTEANFQRSTKWNETINEINIDRADQERTYTRYSRNYPTAFDQGKLASFGLEFDNAKFEFDEAVDEMLSSATSTYFDRHPGNGRTTVSAEVAVRAAALIGVITKAETADNEQSTKLLQALQAAGNHTGIDTELAAMQRRSAALKNLGTLTESIVKKLNDLYGIAETK